MFRLVPSILIAEVQTCQAQWIVAAGSGNSGSESRDHKMSTDILDVQKLTCPSHLIAIRV